MSGEMEDQIIEVEPKSISFNTYRVQEVTYITQPPNKIHQEMGKVLDQLREEMWTPLVIFIDDERMMMLSKQWHFESEDEDDDDE